VTHSTCTNTDDYTVTETHVDFTFYVMDDFDASAHQNLYTNLDDTGNLKAIFNLANDESLRGYSDNFWSGSWPVGNTDEPYYDYKTDEYSTAKLGTKVRIEARDFGGHIIGTAEYAVLPYFQGFTFSELQTYHDSDVTFTNAKMMSTSSGSIGDKLGPIDGVGGSMRSQDNGDLFMDFNHALVANANTGFNSGVTQVRLCTTFKDEIASVSNGHWFGGLGGHHEQGVGSWSSNYESAPNSGYCQLRNIYGETPGNIDGEVVTHSTCTNTDDYTVTETHVDFSIYIKD